MIPRQVQSARKTAMPIPKAKIVMTVRSMRHLPSQGMRKAGLRSPVVPQALPGCQPMAGGSISAAVPAITVPVSPPSRPTGRQRSVAGNAAIAAVILSTPVPALPQGNHDHHHQEKHESADIPFHRRVFLP